MTKDSIFVFIWAFSLCSSARGALGHGQDTTTEFIIIAAAAFIGWALL